MLIGLSGSYCSGKDTVAELLIQDGFTHISLSDMIREEMRTRGIPLIRDNIISTGNELRKTYGAGVLAQRALDRLKTDRCVITSIRSIGELDTLRTRSDFVFVWIDAPIDVRFARMRSRAKPEDAALNTLDAFKQREEREMSALPHEIHLHTLRERADEILLNDSDLPTLTKRLDSLLKRIESLLKTRKAY